MTLARAAGPALAFALAFLVAGCAAPRVGPEAGPAAVDAGDAEIAAAAREAWRRHRAAVASINGWNLKARIAAQTGRRGGSATLLWERRGALSTMQLHGPFGGGRIRITVGPGRAELVDARGRVTGGDGVTAAEALYRRLGWRVPFAQLRRWVRGLPGDGARGVVVDRRGLVKRFVDGDWRVEYAEYAAVGDIDLPRRLTVAARPGRLANLVDGARISPGDRLEVRLVVNAWRELDFGAR